MRKRATMDENSGNPLDQSSWHEKLMHSKRKTRIQQEQGRGPVEMIRRLSSAIHKATLHRDDPEKFVKSTISEDGPEDSDARPERDLFGTPSPACRQLAGVEDWARERKQRELTKKQKKEAIRKEWLETRFKRFSLALFAGIALVAPMVLMVLVPTLKCTLSTTSLSVLFFALTVTYFTNISDRDLVVVTAGYAAVLVVFVGAQRNPAVLG